MLVSLLVNKGFIDMSHIAVEEVGRRRSGQGCPVVGRRLLAARLGEAALGLPVGATCNMVEDGATSVVLNWEEVGRRAIRWKGKIVQGGKYKRCIPCRWIQIDKLLI